MEAAARVGWGVEGDGVWLLMFYAPWCTHNQKLRLGFLTAAKLLRDTLPNLSVGAVNCDKEVDLCRTEKVTGFPTIRLLLPSVGRAVPFTQHENVPYPMIPDLLVGFVNGVLEKAKQLPHSDGSNSSNSQNKTTN